MSKKLVIISLILSTSFTLFAQEESKEQNFGIKFSGFVKNDFFFDTRQTVAAREGHFLLWPSAENIDINGDDINAKANFNFLAVQSRISGAISGPDAFGAKTSGKIEGDFFAQANDNINLFRLRHAFIKLNWSSTELLTGQYWNPLFVTGCFPGTVSFNTGTPFQSFARNPQLRVTHSMGDLKIVVAALGQRDYTSRGVAGISSDYLRNSATPDLHFQIMYGKKDKDAGTDFLSGVAVAYKTIVPRLSSTVATDTTYKVNESVSGLTAMGFVKIKLKPVTIKLQGRYGENIPDILSASGFAIKNVVDTVTGELEYTPLKNMTVWGEIHTNGKKVQIGVFGAFCKSLGSKEALTYTNTAGDYVAYGLATNIESMLRISPRVIFYSGKYKFAAEIEYTSATFGSGFDANYLPAATSQVANTRLLLSAIYSF